MALKQFGLALMLLGGLTGTARAAELPVNFSREIRPILSENCFACHGPDEEQRKGKLRLDTRQGVFEHKEAVKPGDSARSELIKRLLATDEDDVMPPPKTGKKLTPAQIDLLKRWIDQGAKWESHWAFEKPVRPPLPEVKNTAWPRNEIDRFILEKLEKNELAPRPEADRRTLLRRAALDLNGLPPTLEEVEGYLADGSAEAYSKVVDRLMSSASYGEQMARYWLDGARYADSHGYHIDSVRSIWKYRDWVIQAFNENKPFDQFTKEQIAGDLLPDATVSQKIGSGYIRCNMSTGEGGAIEEEYRAKYAFDRLETTSTMWLGLTMTCARCHTHKYDPITHKEYYQLYAFFNTLEEPIMDENKPNPDPFLKIPSEAQAARQNWLKDSIAKAQEKVDAALPELDKEEPGWMAKWHSSLNAGWETLAVSASSANPATVFKTLEDQTVVPEARATDAVVWTLTATVPAGTLGGLRLEVLPPKEPGASVENRIFSLAEIEADFTPEGGPAEKLVFGSAAASASLENQRAAQAIDGKADTFWSATNSAAQARTAVFLLNEPKSLAKSGALAVRLKLKGPDSERAIQRFRVSAAREAALIARLFPVKISPWKMIGPFKAPDPAAALGEEFPPEKELDFAKSYPGARYDVKWGDQPGYEDGKSHVFVHELHGVHGAYYFHRAIRAAAPAQLEISLKADDLVKAWFNGQPLAERSHKWELGERPLRLTLDLREGENQLLVKVVNRQGSCRFRFDKLLAGSQALPTSLAAILAATPEPAGEDAKRVRHHYRAVSSPDWKQSAEDLVLWREENEALDRAIPTTLVAKESAKPRDTFIFTRGEYDKPGEKVLPGVPVALPLLPKDAPTNRLGLAQWLVSPDQPLTARVVVNRFWQQYFGVGLVKTTEDFGLQSEPPSHPELLDWLAVEFMESGWNIKHLQRLIVTSAAYRQSSAAPPGLYARDPENRLLARGPRFRMEAETLRDTALALSGLLVGQIGGQSVKPYQPPGLWEAVSFNNSQKYDQDHGDAQYRRSVYTHWKRQSPPPSMMIFDAPTREYCVVRRPRTNTPLQALAWLNDPQIVEAGRGFAYRMLRSGGTSAQSRIAYGFKLATARDPQVDELAALERVFEEQKADFAKNSAAADQFLGIGVWQPEQKPEPAEFAALATVASMILNLDETLTKN